MKACMRALVGLLALALIAGTVCGQFAKPDEAVSYRKAVMRIIGAHFGRIGAVVKGQTDFDAEAVAHDAGIVATMSTLPWDACLVAGSFDGETTLKSMVLDEKDNFMKGAGAFTQESLKLGESAKTGDLNTVKTQFGNVAKSCKGCHSRYRK
ncbi:MAG: cytochrome c [Desulfobacteraceae bacterium]|nr:cytochrome c [Desulfobacteraceae bacterium]